ncbi:IstB-like ATP binding protein, partial [Pediococcus ethanolidurans]
IIDEVGYLPVDKLGADLLFQLINRRYERRSTIITTNAPLSEWGHVFGDEALANAILDRLVHHSKIIKISGQSYRMREYRETTQTKESKSTKKQLRMKRGQTG